ncbi:hypothetical protein [Allorhizobium undicola]|uniref:hypothetical protein n=1 Tax=Allorhizobium undicola TaxID=78527 RepID=UPI00048590E8|nr:hypothetical protein [Allorhizobium undicola]
MNQILNNRKRRQVIPLAAFFMKLLLHLSHFRTENRFPLFLKMLSLTAFPDGKPVPTFPENALPYRISGRKTGSHFS